MENFSNLPLNRLLIRGAVTCSFSAATTCVQPLFLTRVIKAIASSAFRAFKLNSTGSVENIANRSFAFIFFFATNKYVAQGLRILLARLTGVHVTNYDNFVKLAGP